MFWPWPVSFRLGYSTDPGVLVLDRFSFFIRGTGVSAEWLVLGGVPGWRTWRLKNPSKNLETGARSGTGEGQEI